MKHIFHYFLLAATMLLLPHSTVAASVQNDSIRIESLLAKGALLSEKENKVLFFARQFLGVPYVAHTLDRSKKESLVINTSELDCTTYVENVLALTLCATRGEKRFADFCRQLQQLRYANGQISYFSRLHYFTSWIEDNERMGFVTKVQTTKAPFTAVQKLNIYYMSQHFKAYNMLSYFKACPPEIRATEKSLTGKTYRYIPKASISNTKLMRQTIHDGDILAILTNKKGLDTSHIGIAVWHKDGLHLLNASQIHKKVVEEPMTLRTYMSKHPSQIGIRVCRLKE